jgi:hypothetical protein
MSKFKILSLNKHILCLFFYYKNCGDATATLAGISPFQIMRYLYYPYLMGISALIAILFIPNVKRNRDKINS